MPGTDLTTLLLEVFRRRAGRLTPAEVMRRYRTDRFGRGYYTGLCYKVYATIIGQWLEIADGGFVDWTQQLTGNRKERLLIGGFGVDRLAMPRL